MSEIMDFVTYHLKQVGLDSRSLNGGIILTGGGSQLKHLLQLTEFLTGLNARIGFPNEHLSGDHLEELEKPMYSTCIGLILKGYNDYENKYKPTVAEEVKEKTWKKVEHKADVQIEIEEPVMETPLAKTEEPVTTTPQRKKTLKEFLDSIKTDIINLFQEEDDKNFEEFKNQ
jgi:cell division protein FtsA